MNQKNYIGKKIKQLREDHELSQSELADELGYSSATAIYLIEKGERAPSVKKLKKIAKFFSVPIGKLVGDPISLDKGDFEVFLRSEKQLTNEQVDTIHNFIDFLENKSKK